MRPRQAFGQLLASGSRRPRLPLVSAALAVAAVLVIGCVPGAERDKASAPAIWRSRAIPEAKGEVKEVDGKRVQIRYKDDVFSAITANFERWPTYAHDDARKFPPPNRIPMPAMKGDPGRGRELFMSRDKAPCTGCHLIPGPDVWPAGSVGPDLSVIGDRRLPDQYLFDFVWDARVFLTNPTMTPWGTSGILSPEETAHIVAFLQTLKGNPPFVPPPESDPARNPHTRPRIAPYWGDPLDSSTNPAILIAESALAAWSTKGPSGKACADCHEGGLEKAMKGVATRYPKFMSTYGRVMSIEDYLTVHTPERTGDEMLAQSPAHLAMTILIKMQSNGMPVSIDVTSPEARAAYERGRALYYQRVGQRNHSCADCHDADRGAGRYAGARVLSVAANGLTKHFPVWFTIPRSIWSIRTRFQFCMLPLGTNYIAADAPEYADLELYLTSFDNGKPMSVPGIR
jgi:L-cysteine S-thiosulfotransferase